MTFVDDYFSYFSFLNVIQHHVGQLFNEIFSAFNITSTTTLTANLSSRFATDVVDSLINWLAFDEFQIKLLNGFLFILAANLVLIFLSWRVYGEQISERFLKPATSKTIEELKKSVSLLKLPKEHSPRV